MATHAWNFEFLRWHEPKCERKLKDSKTTTCPGVHPKHIQLGIKAIFSTTKVHESFPCNAQCGRICWRCTCQLASEFKKTPPWRGVWSLCGHIPFHKTILTEFWCALRLVRNSEVMPQLLALLREGCIPTKRTPSSIFESESAAFLDDLQTS